MNSACNIVKSFLALSECSMNWILGFSEENVKEVLNQDKKLNKHAFLAMRFCLLVRHSLIPPSDVDNRQDLKGKMNISANMSIFNALLAKKNTVYCWNSAFSNWEKVKTKFAVMEYRLHFSDCLRWAFFHNFGENIPQLKI